jgi:hypothetical protein
MGDQRETTIHIALVEQIEDNRTESETPGWLGRVMAAWLALLLSQSPGDFSIRHSVAQMLAVSAGAHSHGG